MEKDTALGRRQWVHPEKFPVIALPRRDVVRRHVDQGKVAGRVCHNRLR